MVYQIKVETKPFNPLWMIKPLTFGKTCIGWVIWFLLGFYFFKAAGFPVYFKFPAEFYLFTAILLMIPFLIFEVALIDLQGDRTDTSTRTPLESIMYIIVRWWKGKKK